MKTTNAVSGNTLEAAKEFERILASKPIEEQIAVGMIAENVINGCSWEFTRANPDISRNLEAFKNSQYVSVQEVTYGKGVTGYLVYMQMGRLLELLGPANKGPLNSEDVKFAEDHRRQAVEALAQRLAKGYTGRIGIYCTNDSQSITVQGKSYPAYALTLKEACAVFKNMGYGVVVSGEPRDPDQVVAREDAVIKALLVAPSSNALFLDVAPMGKRR